MSSRVRRRPTVSLRRLSCRLGTPSVALLLGLAALGGCGSDPMPDPDVGGTCTVDEVVAQCPAGSNPIVGTTASETCAQKTQDGYIIGGGSTTAKCEGTGSCEVLCQFQTPCTCGVASLTRDGVVCETCQNQSCGDGRCEGTERPTCEAGDAGCFPCAEDCSGMATCGDGDCTADESPQTCPQDCERTCGNGVCESGEQQSCPNDCPVCGNASCETGELDSCPQDCAQIVCTPSSKICLGNTLRVCAANGQSYTDAECTLSGQVCGRGQCVLPEVCGNGVCETGESTACVGDCQEVCGNGTCGAGEDFATCGQDCPPECGDGICGGGESPSSCSQDCLASCGNGACDNGETRTSCAQDCGFCGDGTCQDGFESPSLNPPSGQVACPQDCTVLTCTTNTDCDDQIGCTDNVCNAQGFCEYAPNHGLCPSLQRCLGNATSDPTGCCADADNDGFAATSCGGSDCNDNDPTVKPGAFEYCDGVDRNCNGVNEPALGQAVRLTNDFVIKEDVAVAHSGTHYLAAWIATPAASREVHYALFDSQLQMVGGVTAISGSSPNGRVRVTFSPQSGRFAVAWSTSEGCGASVGYSGCYKMHWLDAAGNITNSTPVIAPSHDAADWQLLWNDGTYAFAGFAYYSCSNGGCPGCWCPLGWSLASEAGGVTTTVGGFGGLTTGDPGSIPRGPLLTFQDRFGGIFGGTLYSMKADNSESTFTSLVPQTTLTADRLVWDGAHAGGAERDFLVAISRATNTIRYEHFAPNGLLVDSVEVGTAALDPVDTLYVAPKSPGAQGQVAVLAKDAGNFYLFVRNRDSSEALAPGLIAGGQNPTDGHLFFNGNNFVTFWRATAGNVDQLFATTVSCQ